MKARNYYIIALLAILIILIKFEYDSRVFYVNLINNNEKEIKETYKITYLGYQRQSSYTTVVTVLFQFGKSKHSSDDYEKWSSTMISSLSGPVIAFVDYKWEQKFIDKFTKSNTTCQIYAVHSIWDIMRQLEKDRNQQYIQSYQEHQLSLDREKAIHSPGLYAVWNLKHYLLKKATHLNPYKSEFFIYTDSGAWRGRKFTKWPDEEFVKILASKLDDRMLYGQIRIPNMKNFKVEHDIIQAGFFAGSSKAVSRIYDEYYALHDEWFKKGLFVGKEQNLMNALAFQRANSSIVRLRTIGLQCDSRYDEWFFYQYYFAQTSEYMCREDKLSILIY